MVDALGSSKMSIFEWTSHISSLSSILLCLLVIILPLCHK